MTTQQAMAFFHEDGHVPAWNFAKKYAGEGGHVATLPEIIEARLVSKPGDIPWETYFTTNSAEYYGIGSDGREKLIVAHGVGPMSTLEGAKKAYSWEYKDKTGRKHGGRISAQEFLCLESGGYGAVSVIDFRDYLESWGDVAFNDFHSAPQAKLDVLLAARLGPSAYEYLRFHDNIAREWHSEQWVKLPDGGHPMLMGCGASSDCPYEMYPEENGQIDWSRTVPRPIEPGYAIGHLLYISGLVHMHCGGWQGVTCDVKCHGWSDGVRFVGVPANVSWKNGIVNAQQPHEVLRHRWAELMMPNTDECILPRLLRIERVNGEWFTRYPKKDDADAMDNSDIEFHARSATKVGQPRQFKVDDMFFLRYKLSQVVAIAPEGANSYAVLEISPKGGDGLTTVTVQFYFADIDTSQRLPRVKEIKQDYDLLMG